MNQVALVIPYLNATQIYLGLRLAADGQRRVWAVPGGHLRNGETPEQAVTRELYEETQLQIIPDTLKPLGMALSPDGTQIHLFTAQVTGTPDGSKDPDQEFLKFKVVDFTKGVPADLLPHLHGPTNPQDNVLVKHFGTLVDMSSASHLLTPDQLMQGYALSLKNHATPKEAVLFHLGKQVGNGLLHAKEPLVTVAPEHQGKGLGLAVGKALLG